MSKDLTTSAVARNNVLNNRYALRQLEEHLALGGLHIEGEAIFFKSHVAELLDVDARTIDRYLASHAEELKQNGYRITAGQRDPVAMAPGQHGAPSFVGVCG